MAGYQTHKHVAKWKNPSFHNHKASSAFLDSAAFIIWPWNDYYDECNWMIKKTEAALGYVK